MPFRIENKELLSDIKRKIELIKTEATASNLDWVGEYNGEFAIDTYSSILVAPNAGVVYLEHGNSGTYNGNCGEITFSDDVIQCMFRHADGADTEKTFSGSISRLAVVRWGNDVVLVPLARLHGFCLRSHDTAYRPFLIRQVYRKSNRTLSGELVLPRQFQHLFELPVIEARVTNVASTTVEVKPNHWELVNQTVELSCGIKDNVFVGMEFTFDETLSLTIVNVKQDSSTAKLNELVHKRQKNAKELEVGMVVKSAKF